MLVLGVDQASMINLIEPHDFRPLTKPADQYIFLGKGQTV